MANWIGGWVDGRKSRFKDGFQQSKMNRNNERNVVIKRGKERRKPPTRVRSDSAQTHTLIHVISGQVKKRLQLHLYKLLWDLSN